MLTLSAIIFFLVLMFFLQLRFGILYFYSYEILIFSSPTDYGQTYCLISMYLNKFCCFYNCTLIYSILREKGNIAWLHISNTF